MSVSFREGNSVADGVLIFLLSDDDPQLSGMDDFLGEMADMMSQATPTVSTHKHSCACAARPEYSRVVETPGRTVPRAPDRSNRSVRVVQETFEELQQLFVDMFQDDLDPGLFGGLPPGRSQSPPSTSSPPPPPVRPPPPGRNNNAQAPPARHDGADKRGGSPAKRPRPGRGGLEPDLGLSGFCFMVSLSHSRVLPTA